MSRDVLEELVTKFAFEVSKQSFSELDEVNKKLDKILKTQTKMNKVSQKSIGITSALTRGLRRLFVGAGAVMGIQGLVKNFRELDLARRSIEGLTGSTQDFEFLKEEAFRTATAIDVVAQSYKGFYAAANMSKFSKDQIQGMYGDLLTGLRGAGSTPERVKGALLAIEQMFSKGTIQAQELRLQLGNALPGAFELMASAVGVTTKELDSMMRKGLLPATKYVPLLIKEIKGYYESGFIKNVKSLDAAMINLGNAWKLFQDEIMRGSAGQALAETLQDLTGFLRSPEAITIAKGIGQALNLVARSLGVIVKHFRILLFLIGINMLSQAPSVISKLTRMVIRFNRELMVTGAVTGGLNKILPRTLMLLKAIGKSGLLLMKNFWWVFAIVAVLTTIGLALEDIFLYLKDPNALTLTKELVAKYPEMGEALERIKKGLEDFKDLWVNQLQPQLMNFLDSFSRWVASEHPALGALFEFVIKSLMDILDLLGDILNLTNQIDEKNPFNQKQKQKQAKTASGQRVSGAIAGGLGGAAVAATLGLSNPLGWAGLIGAGAIGGYKLLSGVQRDYNLQKSETHSPTINVTNNITGGQYASPIEIAQAVDRQLSSAIDRANMSTMADRPRLYSTMADKPRLYSTMADKPR